MTPTTTASAFRGFFDRFALKPADPEDLREQARDDDEEPDDEHRFSRRDEAFYWGWSMNAFW